MFVRWENLTIDADERARLPGYREAAVVRHFDAPEALDIRFYEVRAKSALNRVPERSQMPFRWTINPYRGCTHACRYCFARPTHTYLGMDAGRDFEREIVVKVNVPEVLRRELARPSWQGEHVAMGTNTDPYQWVEGRYKLMPRDLGGTARRGQPVLGPDEVAAAAARPAVAPAGGRAGPGEREPLGPDARREGVAGQRAAHPASAGAAGGGCGAQPRGHPHGDPRRAAHARHQRRPRAGRADPRAGRRGGGDQRSAASACTCAARCAAIFFEWLRSYRPDLVERYEELYRRGAYAPPEERRRLSALLRRGQDRDRPSWRGTFAMRGAAAGGGGEASAGGREPAASAPRPAGTAQTTLF